MTRETLDLRHGMYRRIYAGAIRGRRINSVSMGAELLFWRMLLVADDFGSLEACPRVLLAMAMTLRREVSEENLGQWLGELEGAGLIARYEAAGDHYAHIIGWEHFQPAPRNGRRIQRYPRVEESGGNQGIPDASGGFRGNPDSNYVATNVANNQAITHGVNLPLAVNTDQQAATNTAAPHIHAKNADAIKDGQSVGNPGESRCTSVSGSVSRSESNTPLPPDRGNGASIHIESIFPQASIPTPAKAPASSPASTENPKPTRGRKAAGAGDESKKFLLFWLNWPPHRRKAGRKKCCCHWSANGLDDRYSEIMKGLALWKSSEEWKCEKGKYVPAPLVWLHDERWESAAALEQAPDPDDFEGRVTDPEELAAKIAAIRASDTEDDDLPPAIAAVPALNGSHRVHRIGGAA